MILLRFFQELLRVKLQDILFLFKLKMKIREVKITLRLLNNLDLDMQTLLTKTSMESEIIGVVADRVLEKLQ